MALQLSESPTGVNWHAQPDHTPQANTARWLLIGAASVTGVIALGFALLGAWLVLPFAGLEVAALWLGLHYFSRHASDSEDISLTRTTLRVTTRSADHTTATEFPAYWAQVRLQAATPMAPAAKLFVGSHGHEIEIGRLLSNTQKQALARALRDALRRQTAAHHLSDPATLSEQPNQP